MSRQGALKYVYGTNEWVPTLLHISTEAENDKGQGHKKEAPNSQRGY